MIGKHQKILAPKCIYVKFLLHRPSSYEVFGDVR